MLQQFEMGNRWIQTRIDYHPCITSEPTNQIGEVTLLEVRTSELEWMKSEQHFIIQDSNFQKRKHSLNLYFDENDILRS